MISGDTTIARLLDEHPELVEVLASYHPHFSQLKAMLLRGGAPPVTLAQAAQMAGVRIDDLLRTLRRSLGETDPMAEPARSEPGGGVTGGDTIGAPARVGESPAPKPAALDRVPESRRVHLDVRPDIQRGQEPFAKIMAAVKALAPEQVLVLRSPFEPIPLYDILGKRGLAHWTERLGLDDWSISFYRQPDARSEEGEPSIDSDGPTHVVDVRGLEPPGPMVRVLEELERLRPGERLEILHERRPMFLYPQLDDRGFSHETDEPEPGLVRIMIRRPGTEP
jgi:uncharacterized protein (DUF2249 family)